MTLTVSHCQSLHRNPGHPYLPSSKNKQLVYSQIGVNSISAGEVDMSSIIRLYPACYNGDIQAGSPVVHINLQYKKWKEAGKKVEDNHAHQTQIYLYKKVYH